MQCGHKKQTSGKVMVALSVLSAAIAGYHKSAGAQVMSCTPIDFGTFGACPSTAGTVTVTPAGVTTPSPFCLTQISGGKRANCFLAGTTGLLSITVASPVTLTGPGSMTVDTFRFSADTPPAVSQPALTVSLNSSTPTLNFYIGATLNIGAAQAGGSYSGTYVVTVNNP